jgi:simple sugar transport system permease protein
MTAVDGYLESAVRSATPLAFAAAGELVAERSGVINLSLEGSIACGAFVAFLVAGSAGPSAALLAGGAAGAALALLFAFFVLTLRAQQIIAGTAVTMLGLGLTATMNRVLFAGTTTPAHVATLSPVKIPLLSEIPVFGAALFHQSAATYALYALFPALAWFFYRTTAGVALRAVGEFPHAVRASGHRPDLIQFLALGTCGLLAGIGGATLVVVDTATFSDGISAGRGFIAVAVVALGRWTPLGVAAGALVFGGASALQFLAQALGWQLPYNLVLAAPYVLTLIAMAAFRGSGAAPANLGKPSIAATDSR